MPRRSPVQPNNSSAPPDPRTRPVIMGRRGVVAAGHYLAASAGLRILCEGGNAIDAAAATGFCEAVVEPHNNGIGGEAPTLIYSAREKKTFAISGMGWSPKKLTIAWCRRNGVDLIPGDGFLPACVPAVVGTWAEALARFGTMSLSQVLQPAIEFAEHGFPMYENLHGTFGHAISRISRLYPSTFSIYYPGGQIPEIGSPVRNPDLAGMFRLLCEAERKSRSRSREGRIEAARRLFYEGRIAGRIAEFTARHKVEDGTGKERKCLLTYEDLAQWRPLVEDPLTYPYRGYEVHKCSSWSQGPVFLQQLALLRGFDLAAMGHNSTEYLHTWIECAKLAFADREAYYGDPLFDEVPFDWLLSDEYNAMRRGLIGKAASLELRPGTDREGHPGFAPMDVRADNRRAMGLPPLGDGPGKSGEAHDTTHLDVIDADGNMVASTPSGGWLPSSPIIPGLGFPLGTRGQMFYLNPARANALEPRKRPRCTLTPSLVTRQGEPYMAFGTPGGDSQDQWTLQFFLNIVEFGMGLQEALEAPTVHSLHFPSSFHPRASRPGRVGAERRIPARVIEALRRRGHDVTVAGNWGFGRPTAIQFDKAKGLISGAASPRHEISYAMGW